MWIKKMFSGQRRSVAIAVSAALALVSAPQPGYALFDWLCPSPGTYCGTVSTCYTPPFSGQMVGFAPRYSALPWRPAAPAVAVRLAPAATTCCYVPVTCYRTEYRLTPVSTCRAVSYVEPCSGCPTVTYRPVTSWAYRPLAVPYNTYRIVYSAPAVSRPACCTMIPAAVSAPGCPSCVRGAPPASTIAPIPASSGVLPAPSLIGPAPSMSPPPINSTPPGPISSLGLPSTSGTAVPSSGSAMFPPGPISSPIVLSAPSSSSIPKNAAPGPLAPSAGQSPIQTFDSRTTPGSQPAVKPTTDSNTGPAPGKMPDLGAPQGRTAHATIRQAVYVRPVSQESQAGLPVRPRLDTSGWEAAGD